MTKNIFLGFSFALNLGLVVLLLRQTTDGPTENKQLKHIDQSHHNTITSKKSSLNQNRISPHIKLPEGLHLNLKSAEVLAWVQAQDPSKTLATLKSLGLYHQHHLYSMARVPLYEQWILNHPQEALEYLLNVGESSTFIDLALSTWQQSDSNEAQSYIRQHPNSSQQKKLIHSWGKNTAKKNGFAKAQTWAKSWPSQELQNQALHGAFIGLAQKEPKSAYQKWETYSDHPKALEWLKSILLTWGKSSPKDAIEVALNIPQSLWKAEALLSASRTWSHYAPLEALTFKCEYPEYLRSHDSTWSTSATRFWKPTLALVNQLDEGIIKSTIMSNLARIRIQVNPEEAWELIQQHTSSQSQYIITDLFINWSQKSLEKAKAAALSAPHHHRTKAITGISSVLAKSSPKEAITFAKKHVDHSSYQHTLANILVYWGYHDLKAALKYLEQDIDSSQQDSVISTFVSRFGAESLMTHSVFKEHLEKSTQKELFQKHCITNMIHTNFDLAQSWFDTMSDGKIKGDLLSTFTSTLSQVSLKKAWDWTLKLNNLDLKLKAQKQFIQNLAYRHPSDAHHYLLLIPESAQAEFESLYRNVSQYLSKYEPKKAFQLALSKVNVSRYSYIYTNIYSDWSKKDLNDSLNSLEDINDDKTLDAAQRGILNFLAESNPEKAIALMKEWGKLDQHLSSFIQSWGRQDPKAAATWSKNNPKLLEGHPSIFENLISQWKRNDSASAKEFIDSLSQAEQDLLKSKTLAELPSNKKSYSEKAAELANLSVKEKSSKANSFIYSWANENPQEAYLWLKQQESEVIKKFNSSLLNTWASKDPKGLLAQIQSHQDINLNSSMSYNLAQNLAKTDIETAKSWIGQMDTGENKSSALQGLSNSWANQNPSEAIQWANELSPGVDRDNAISNIMNSWITKNQDNAIQWAQSLDSVRDRERTMSHIISRIVDKDVKTSIELLNEISSENYRQTALRPIAEHLSEEDPERAIEWASNFTDIKEREQVIKTSARLWSTKDLEGYKDWISTITNESEKNTYLVDAIQANSYKNINTAKDLINLMNEGNKKDDMAKRLVSSWGSKQPKAAAEWIQTQENSGLRKRLYEQLMGNWSRYDHKGAAEFVLQLPEEDLKDSSLARSIAQNWSKYEPQDAIDWAMELPEGKSRNEAVSSWVDSVRQTQPFLASDVLRENSDISVSSYIYERMLKDMARTDLSRATSWMEEIEDKNLKNRALAGISDYLIEQDPQSAIDWASYRNDETSMEQVLKKWVSKDHVQAANYMRDNNLANKNALRSLVSSWRHKDKDSLEVWLKKLPQGEVKDQAIPVYISNISYKDPKHAKTFLDQVSGEAYEKSATTVFRYMSRQDPSEAAEWFDEISQNSPKISSGLLSSLASSWVAKDHESAVQWGNSLRDSQHQRNYYYNVSRTLKINSVEKMSEWLPKVPSGEGQNGFIEYAVRTYHASDKNLSREFLNYLQDETARQELLEKYNL